MTETFTFSGTDDEHIIGIEGCDAGWCGTLGFPRPCDETGCAGLVHANFGDGNSNGDYWLYQRCDVCEEEE